MTYFLFNNPGEKINCHASFIQKKKSLGRHAFITHIYHRLRNQSKTWPTISIKNRRTQTEKGAADEENNSPLSRFLNSENSERQEIKKKEH